MLPVPDKATEQEAARLLKRLAQLIHDWPSEPALRDLSPPMVDALLRYIGKEQSRYEWLLVYPFLLWGVWNVFDGKTSLVLTWLLIMMACVNYYIVGHSYFARQRCAVYALTQIDDLRVLPTLIQATRYSWGQHPQVTRAICRLLQQVTEEHIGLLSQEAQNKLWNLVMPPVSLKTGYEETLAVAALQAFAHVGNQEMLARMQHFARNTALHPHYQQVQEQMEHCLPLMVARLQRQGTAETLMRAASAPTDTQAGVLLRPTVHSATPEPAEQLLRADMSDKDAARECLCHHPTLIPPPWKKFNS